MLLNGQPYKKIGPRRLEHANGLAYCWLHPDAEVILWTPKDDRR